MTTLIKSGSKLNMPPRELLQVITKLQENAGLAVAFNETVIGSGGSKLSREQKVLGLGQIINDATTPVSAQYLYFGLAAVNGSLGYHRLQDVFVNSKTGNGVISVYLSNAAYITDTTLGWSANTVKAQGTLGSSMVTNFWVFTKTISLGDTVKSHLYEKLYETPITQNNLTALPFIPELYSPAGVIIKIDLGAATTTYDVECCFNGDTVYIMP